MLHKNRAGIRSNKSIPYNKKGNIGGEEGAGAESISEGNIEDLVKMKKRCIFTEGKINLKIKAIHWFGLLL